MQKLLVLSVVVVVGVMGWRMRSSHERRRPIATNRLWIDHLPRNERDAFNVFALVGERSSGWFAKRTPWTGSWEGFRFEIKDDQVRVVYPQTGERETFRVKARECEEEGMDFCLDVEGASRGVKRYYSRRGWEIRSRADLEAAVQRIED